MQYQISHTTTYSYSTSVSLNPHLIRLRPRSDGNQMLHSFALTITPTPLQTSTVIDLDGNSLVKVWFDCQLQTQTLVVKTLSNVETYRDNPFNYLLEPWAMKLPFDYPASLLTQLQPYLYGQQTRYPTAIDPIAIKLAQDLCQTVNGDPTNFLVQLNEQIHDTCRYTVRETGEPLAAGITWTQQQGSCRDLAVLFIEVCRAMGLAARFVSGYYHGDPDSPEYTLHAWAEVYLPGAGWCGYDPTHRLAIADQHIALVASPSSFSTASVSGTFSPVFRVQSTISYQLAIQRLEFTSSNQSQQLLSTG